MPVFFFTVLGVLGGNQTREAAELVIPTGSLADLGAASAPFLGFLVVSFAVSRLIAKLSEAPV
jgi:hypothetical protein